MNAIRAEKPSRVGQYYSTSARVKQEVILHTEVTDKQIFKGKKFNLPWSKGELVPNEHG